MSDVADFELELMDLAKRYQKLPQSLRDGLEQLIDNCGHYKRELPSHYPRWW